MLNQTTARGWIAHLGIAALAMLGVATTTTAASAATYHVATWGSDSNPGTSAAPFRTINHAARRATAGSTVYVNSGTYREVVSTRTNGTAGARIRFASTVPHGAKIVFANSSGYAWQNGASYVDIEGFDITGSGVGGIYNWGSHVRILGNRIHNIKSICNSEGGGGIVAGSYQWPVDVTVARNIIHDIAWFSGGCNWVHGIYMSHDQGKVHNNIVYRTGGCGIHLWHKPYRVNIANNLVFNNHSCGIVVGAGDESQPRAADYISVVNNVVMDHRSYGITEQGLVGSNNVYRNNIVVRNATNWRLRRSTAVGTITTVPTFVRYQVDGGGDYRPAAGSSTIDRGTSAYASTWSINLVARPKGGAFDIGPYEYVR